MSSISESISLQSLSVPQSVRSETKDKFDVILRKNRTISKEKLLNDIESISVSSRNLNPDKQFNKKKHEEEEERASKKLILNKFLNDSTSLGASISDKTVIMLVKPPVPKPRKKKLEYQRRDSVNSIATFEVTSPKILLSPYKTIDNKGSFEMLRRDSITSVRTFEVTSPKVTPKFPTTEIDNSKNVQVIGDLVLHESPAISKIAVFASQSEIVEKADNETLSDRNSSISNSSRGTFTIDKENYVKSELQSDNAKKMLRPQGSKNKPDSTESEQENKKVKPEGKKRLHKKSHISESNSQIKGNVSKPYDYHNITEIKVHKTDKLLLKSFVIHPVVKIHIVDIRTGAYFKKSDKNRPVVFYYENDSNDYILPVMTGYYNLQEKRSFYPMWEETILLNEDFQYIINEHVIIFFEIMDFATTNFGTLKKDKDCDKGWYKIAFSFLKVIGQNNAENVNKKVRLQLYYPQNTASKSLEHNRCELWDWWKKKNPKKYPSTLYITIKKVISPTRVIETFRSKTPLQKEEIGVSLVKEPNIHGVQDDQIKQDTDKLKIKWQKMFNKDKKLPEECVFQLDTFEEGCFVLKFSNNGLYLACSVKISDDFQIVTYLVKNFEETFRFKSHKGLVYSIAWSQDDKYLITASSDNTVAIWNFDKKLFFQILPHPSFVYTSEINSENIIATGCYDQILRIWQFNQEINEFLLHQELEEHKGYVTSLCFSHKNNTLLYSADSCGKILQWNKDQTYWKLNRKLDIIDLRETKINQIIVFSNDKKMLVHSRDSALRIISIANVCVIHWLHGALNTRVQTFCDISPKWLSYVASGSENGLVIVWDANTGKDVKTYESFSNKSKPANCVQFHPTLNMLAASHYGTNEPILIYCTKEDEDMSDIEQFGKIKAKIKHKSENGISMQQEKLDFRKVLKKMDQLLV